MSQKIAKRKAGRPPLAPSDDVQVTMRRERDRIAQRQSRLRKANALSEKDERIDKLSRTIEDLTSVFTDFNEMVFRSSLVQGDYAAAKQLKHLADRFLFVAQDAARTEEELERPSSPVHAPQHLLVSPSSSSRPARNPTAGHSQRPSSSSSGLTRSSTPVDRPWSPRLTYGLLTNPTNTSVTTTPVFSGLPLCLRVPKNTFAWHLLKETFERGFTFFEILSEPGAITSRGQEIFQFTAPHEPIDETCRRLLVVIEYFFTVWGCPITERTKKMDLNSPEFRVLEGTALAEREKMDLLNMLVKRDIHLRGESVDDYMHAWSVERYLDVTWGIRVTSTTASLKSSFWGRPNNGITSLPDPPPAGFGADPTSADKSPWLGAQDDFSNFASSSEDGSTGSPANGFKAQQYPESTSETSVDVANLLEQLVHTACCFGNVPRFVRQRVDEAVSKFLSERGLVTSGAITDYQDMSMPIVAAI